MLSLFVDYLIQKVTANIFLYLFLVSLSALKTEFWSLLQIYVIQASKTNFSAGTMSICQLSSKFLSAKVVVKLFVEFETKAPCIFYAITIENWPQLSFCGEMTWNCHPMKRICYIEQIFACKGEALNVFLFFCLTMHFAKCCKKISV